MINSWIAYLNDLVIGVQSNSNQAFIQPLASLILFNLNKQHLLKHDFPWDNKSIQSCKGFRHDFENNCNFGRLPLLNE